MIHPTICAVAAFVVLMCGEAVHAFAPLAACRPSVSVPIGARSLGVSEDRRRWGVVLAAAGEDSEADDALKLGESMVPSNEELEQRRKQQEMRDLEVRPSVGRSVAC